MVGQSLLVCGSWVGSSASEVYTNKDFWGPTWQLGSSSRGRCSKVPLAKLTTRSGSRLCMCTGDRFAKAGNIRPEVHVAVIPTASLCLAYGSTVRVTLFSAAALRIDD